MARTKSGEKKKRQQSVQKRDTTPDDEFEVEKIVDCKGAGKSLLYMVKWKGYPESDNTWENPSDLPKNLVNGYAKKSDKKEAVTPKTARKTAKKTPKKESPKKEKKPVVITGRKLQDNVIHYEVKGRQKSIPIYEFDDFQPVYDYEMNAPAETEDDGGLIPERILEKKGSQYHVLWKGRTQHKSWENTKNLICVPLMKEFDDRTDSDSEDEIYEVKTIVSKRKMGRGYEYEVIWKGGDGENTTWEPEGNLGSCKDKIRAFEKNYERKIESDKAAKAKKSQASAEKRAAKREEAVESDEAAKSDDAAKSDEATPPPKKRGRRPKK